jgi:glucose-1-phosphate thymidylyltransferase
MRGNVLAGGTGSRLWPITKVISKQLLPVYDKPMIYYPIATLMLAGIREILIITTPHEQAAFIELLGNGEKFGIKLTYEIQPKPEGLAQAFIIGEKFLKDEPCLMILGDNIFHGMGLGNQLRNQLLGPGAHIFTYPVTNPTQYGVLNLDKFGNPESIEEKPEKPNSNLAITGLYYFDNRVVSIAKDVKPSNRGELEITSIIDWYLQNRELTVTQLSRGTAWLDTGTPSGLHDAASYVRIIEERTGLKIGSIEEIALANNYISGKKILEIANENKQNEYGKYLGRLLNTSEAF